MAVAVAPIVGGIVMLDRADSDDDPFVGMAQVFGGTILMAGVTMEVGGIAMLAVGFIKKSNCLPEGRLDDAPVEMLQRYRLSESTPSPTGPRVFVSPITVPRGAGVGLTVVSW
jgi:hypothetical protein